MTKMLNNANKMKELLHLEREPVGVKFLNEEEYNQFIKHCDGQTKTRYCQALMRAGNGERIIITKDNISCPASAAAFGLKPLPEMLSSGQMLLNMGLFATQEAGKRAMEGMTRLKQGEYHSVLLAPLKEMKIEPDVVVIESLAEHIMWVALADIFQTGSRLEFSTAVFQATCVDCAVIPFKSGKINATLGCYGCRDATNIQDGESLIGIPFSKLDELVENLEQLASKAMIKARAKEAFHSFKGCGE